MRIYTIFLLLVFAIACNTRKKEEEKQPALPPEVKKEEPVAGGACTYKDNVYPAKVVKIEGDNENSLNITFEVTLDKKKKESITYFSVYQRNMTMNEVEQNHILLDSTYKFIQSEIISGACNPKVKKFVFEPYQK